MRPWIRGNTTVIVSETPYSKSIPPVRGPLLAHGIVSRPRTPVPLVRDRTFVPSREQPAVRTSTELEPERSGVLTLFTCIVKYLMVRTTTMSLCVPDCVSGTPAPTSLRRCAGPVDLGGLRSSPSLAGWFGGLLRLSTLRTCDPKTRGPTTPLRRDNTIGA